MKVSANRPAYPWCVCVCVCVCWPAISGLTSAISHKRLIGMWPHHRWPRSPHGDAVATQHHGDWELLQQPLMLQFASAFHLKPWTLQADAAVWRKLCRSCMLWKWISRCSCTLIKQTSSVIFVKLWKNYSIFNNWCHLPANVSRWLITFIICLAAVVLMK